MTNPHLTKLGQLCRHLAGNARGFAREMATAVTEAFRHRLPPRRQVTDLYELQVVLGDELEAMYAQVAELYDRCAAEVERARRLRRLRERLASELTAALSRVKKTLAGSCDPGTIDEMLRPIRRLRPDPAALKEQAEGFHAALVDPALGLPPPGPGADIDPASVARSFEEPMARLGETLADLTASDDRLRFARLRKDAALERFQTFFHQVSNLCTAVYQIAGHERIAERLGGSVGGTPWRGSAAGPSGAHDSGRGRVVGSLHPVPPVEASR